MRLRFIRIQMAIAAVQMIATAAVAADAEHGEQLAKRWCATCHLVDGNQGQASADVPAFATIARKPDFTPEKLASFLLEPHPKMPSFPLSRREAADIAAYIGSLGAYPPTIKPLEEEETSAPNPRRSFAARR